MKENARTPRLKRRSVPIQIQNQVSKQMEKLVKKVPLSSCQSI